MAGALGPFVKPFLVTRPDPDAGATVDRLAALGIASLPAPVMVRQTLPTSLPDPAGFAALALTSANALRALAERDALPAWRHLPVFAVGDRTAWEAREAGFATVSSAAGNLADLVNSIAHARLTGPVFHPAGRHLSGDLARSLALHAIMVVTARLYDMVPVPSLPPPIADRLAKDAFGGALVYSQRSASILASLVGEKIAPMERRGLAMLCLSEAVAVPLLEARFTRIHLADRPDEEAMLSLALAFSREQVTP